MHHSIYNLKKIEKEINFKKEVSIIAVSKTFPINEILPLLKYGHLNFGENKVQEAQLKWEGIKNTYPNIKLHMVGKLQTNKVKLAVKLFDYIHSVDTLKLAKKIKSEQEKIKKNLKLFIQVNIGNEKQKSGILKNELKDFYECLVREYKINVIGLMCIPPIDIDSKKVFEWMKNMRDNLGLNELSMGMSSDYLEAVKKESTFIRIGSKIFGERN
tara:strand:+ start:1266 stop:1907 length:642 start_codon:yes stop_codon:yes gene_type:complete